MSKFIENINDLKDLKRLPIGDLPKVCHDLREIIIDTVSQNGGHIAPSLGVVELSVALHYVFDSPNDKIVWDVGHQSYVHKILTDRKATFSSLRQTKGISGFPKIKESLHDSFGTGHSSTSISAALGIAKAMKKKNQNNWAIAVIGDGSMTGGLAFEGLNQAGHKVGNLITILNDNEMSISPNVGALSKFLSTRIYGKTGRKVRQILKELMLHIPLIGNKLFKISRRAEESAVGFFTPGLLFEAFGFDYIGPLDGHNLEELITVFNDIKPSPNGDRPILVHIITKKGKGYKFAEEKPTSFHGTGPFDKKTGKVISSGKLTFTKAFEKSMLELGNKNQQVLGITAAMSTGTGLDAFSKKYPDRFFDVGIAEGHAVTFAAGLATQGFRPVVAIYSTFLQRAYDHIIHDVCLQNLPVTFAIDRAGLVGEDGPTHHGVFDISYLRGIPNLVLMAPRDDKMLETMLNFSVNHNGPCAFRYPRGNIPEHAIEDVSKEFNLGKAEIVHYNKKYSTIIIAVGNMVNEACLAAKKLNDVGIKTIVVDPRFIKPFDFNLLNDLLNDCHNILTIEENVLSGGFGSMIGEWLLEKGLNNVRLNCLGIKDEFVEHGDCSYLRSKYNLDVNGIVNTVKNMLNNENQIKEETFFAIAGAAVSPGDSIPSK